ncbi:MAG TPA: hypothetical protein VHK47_00305 [Polyangia bacterium]|jgi:hypothetical protein|nr:hypothetical protein [Polyangia bacterium]
MASITYWHRLEPRPRAPSLAEPLSARVRDPLWFLARQWQFGEFQGEDAGSPAFARVAGHDVPLTEWRAGAGAAAALPPGTPVEPLLEREAFTPDLSLRVELAQTFEALLGEGGALPAQQIADVLAALRTSIPLAAPPADDPDANRLFLVAARRAFDGVALYQAARATPPGLPAGVALPAGTDDAVSAAQQALVSWVASTLGEIGADDAATWQPERLEYAASLLAPSTDGDALELVAGSSPDGAFEWHAFSLARASAPAARSRPESEPKPWSIIPTHVRFRGMPNARWWDFENGTTDFGDIRPDRRDLARLVVMDFMLVHSNDWFVIPYDMPVGCLGRIDSLVVRDVFGGDTLVERADRNPLPAGQRWSLYSVTADGGSSGFADFLLLPPTAADLTQTSAPIEDVRFLRDELANLAWGVEETIEGDAGRPRPGHERSVARAPQPSPPPGVLSYRIQSDVPGHWIPFLPVTVDANAGSIVLERGGMPAPGGGLIRPAGRILSPSSRAGGPYRIFEEEVSRAGTRVVRVICRARWIDGSTHLWIARRKSAGLGAGSSALVFDDALGG